MKVRLIASSPHDPGWPPRTTGEMDYEEARAIARHYDVVFMRALQRIPIPSEARLRRLLRENDLL